MTLMAEFESAVHAATPRAAVVLGSGLGRVMDGRARLAEIEFAAIPGFAPPTVAGHGGRLVLADWQGLPLLAFLGRMHFYEGHPWPRVLGTVKLAAALGCTTLLLTNAAGGIRDDLNPGDFMVIRDHLPLLDPAAWRAIAAGKHAAPPYSVRLLEAFIKSGQSTGTYAGLTGPTYETPAEIRALRAMGADAVGMSTVMEALEAGALGMEVAAVSCITNKAAGLAAGTLQHTEVQDVAGQPASVARLERIVEAFLSAAG